MKYRVQILHRARRDQREIVAWIAERSRWGAQAWIAAYEKMFIRLSEQADTLALALENDEFEEEIREALFKTRRGLTYRAIFVIVSDEVRVLRIRGPGQDTLSPEDIV